MVDEDNLPPAVHKDRVGADFDQAAVSRLVLTHLSPGLSEEEATARAAITYDGAIEVAHAGTMIEA